jgi:hypothetical protein
MPNREEVEEYFAKERGFAGWPACFAFGTFYGGEYREAAEDVTDQ